jgi:5-hydroxyisourate hydrolase
MTGRLTTHVLDIATGRPAVGMRIMLRLVEGEPLGVFTTNNDGRCDEPLLEGDAVMVGEYELLFDVGGWQQGGFYAKVPVRFRITDPSAHYHVPLIMAPFGYSTYRGS